MKLFFSVVSAAALAGCSMVDPMFGTGEGTVVSVTRDRGCLVTFRVKGKSEQYVTVATTRYQRDICKQLQPQMVVPVVVDPVQGDYPYVLFGGIRNIE